MGTRKLARKYQNKKRNNLLGMPCCAPCGTFMAIAVFFVPLLVFLVAAVCAVPIWGMECLWQTTGPVAGPESDVCLYYEWWKCRCPRADERYCSLSRSQKPPLTC